MLCLAACNKDDNTTSGGSAGFKSVKMSVQMSGETHFAEEYTPSFSDGKLTGMLEKTWNSTGWTPDGKPTGLVQSSERTYKISWNEGSKKLGGTVSEMFLNEDSGKLEAGETHSIDGSFDANHNILSIKGMYNEESFQYNSNKQISKMTMGTYSYDFTWENGNMVRCTSSGGSALIFLYGDEDNTFPANANLVMGLVVESEPLAIFGQCGPATKKLPVGYIQDFVSSSIEYAITYEKDNSGRIVKMTSKMAQGDEYAHVRVLEIKY